MRKILIVSVAFLTTFANAQTNTFPASGKVGIGTMTPESPFTVKDSEVYNIATFDSRPTGGYLTFRTAGTLRGHLQYGLTVGGSGNGNYILLTNADSGGSIALQTHNSSGVFNGDALTVNSEGQVGIGNHNTKGYKLAVSGNVIAESVTVKLQGSWPDYVFKKDYKLKPLKEVEAFIKSNNHLPDIPSASSVAQNGIVLEQMNIKLLKKIEELTLYIINQNKRIEELEKQGEMIKEQGTEIKGLQDMVFRSKKSENYN